MISLLETLAGSGGGCDAWGDPSAWTSTGMYASAPVRTRAGTLVSEENALQVSAVFRAVDLVSGLLACLPLGVYELIQDGGDGQKRRVREHPLHEVLNLQPNRDMVAVGVRRTMHAWVMLYGNAYAEIARADSGAVELWPIHPSRVQVKRHEKTDDLFYRVWEQKNHSIGTPIDFDPADILHIGGLGYDGLSGFGIIRQLAANDVGRMKALTEYAERFFGQGTNFNTVFTTAQKLDQKSYLEFVRQIKESHAGPQNSGRPLVTHSGVDVKRTGSDNDKSQMIESMRFSVEDVSRWTGVPPHMLAEMSNATFSNITEQVVSFVKFTLSVPVKAWEQPLTVKLLSPDERLRDMCIEASLEGLLRGDPKTRSEFYDRMVKAGLMTPDEARRRENLPTMGGAAEMLWMQGAMQPLEKLAMDDPEPAVDGFGSTSPDDDVNAETPDGESEARGFDIDAWKRGLIVGMESVLRAAETRRKKAWAASKRTGAAAETWRTKWNEGHAAYLAEHLRPVICTAAQCSGMAGQLNGAFDDTVTAIAGRLAAGHVARFSHCAPDDEQTAAQCAAWAEQAYGYLTEGGDGTH